MLDCNNNHLSPEDQLKSVFTKDAEGNVGLRVIPIEACEDDAIDCSNPSLTVEQLLSMSIGASPCGKPALRLSGLPEAIVPAFMIYEALISQNGLNAPVVIEEFENTLGLTPTFSRLAPGIFEFNAPGKLTLNKTSIEFGATRNNLSLGGQSNDIIVGDTTMNVNQFTFYSTNAGSFSDDNIKLTLIRVKVKI